MRSCSSNSAACLPRRISSRHRRGVMIVVALIILAVLAVLGSSFSFWMRSDLASVEAVENQMMARQAAESGMQFVMHYLREHRVNMDDWYNNKKFFRRIAIHRDGEGVVELEAVADEESEEGVNAWRFSIVNYERDGIDAYMRYGLSDEAGKVNINTASREQLLNLFDQFEFEGILSPELADAIIDWRDENDKVNSVFGAESAYYMTLNPPYRAKNRYFESVEELLKVKGFNANGQILYGEDYNRNGYLDENEDDGPEGVFPPDDGDGELDQGIYPLVTVYSWDWNSGNDNKQRLNLNTVKLSTTPGEDTGEPGLNGDGTGRTSEESTDDDLDGEGDAADELTKALANAAAAQAIVPEYIYDEVRPEVIEFITEAQKRGYRFRSVGELMGLEVFEDGSSNYDRAWRQFTRQRREGEKSRMTEFEEEETDAPADGVSGEEGSENGENGEEGDANQEGDENDERGGLRGDRENDKDQSDENDSSLDSNEDNNDPLDENKDEDEEARDKRDSRRNQNRRNTEDTDGDVDARIVDSPTRTPINGGKGRGEDKDDEPKEENKKNKGTPIISPVTSEDMAILVDRFTALNAPAIPGQININTAPLRVLRSLPGITEEEVTSILSKRSQITGEEKETIAWLVSQQALEPEKFALLSNMLTTRSIQFTIESIGFADHVGAFKRIQAVVEMRGHIAQLKYYRDISNLGIGYPVRDDERSEGFAYRE